ncbi:hypothetical protein RJ639_034702 [Escallonia herrerae]|uniref:Reverse transcriptase Ty1/copia-type domain-containing protein n=1 Tax=Escallonia herrerae TaxID=1293975 RepID=A0AA89BB44_9ASTE|nr:hypothetical protein RJ639_034702 [Escallonia herrerae]
MRARKVFQRNYSETGKPKHKDHSRSDDLESNLEVTAPSFFMYVTGKELWGILDGTLLEPKDTKSSLHGKYIQNVKNILPELATAISETVYMHPRPGLDNVPFGFVCRLRRSLFEVNQAPHAWFEKISSTVMAAQFHESKYDHSRFTLEA